MNQNTTKTNAQPVRNDDFYQYRVTLVLFGIRHITLPIICHYPKSPTAFSGN